MEVEFMTADTPLPPCMPLPRAMLRLPISSTAKVMYARMLDIVFVSGIEDTNGILFIHFPIVELAAALARSTMTVKRSLNELEDAGLILRVRQGFGEPNKIYAPCQCASSQHIHAAPLSPRRQAASRFRGLSHSPLPPAQRTVSSERLNCCPYPVLARGYSRTQCLPFHRSSRKRI